MKQEYYCEECDLLATCTVPLGTDVEAGIEIVSAAHAKKSPGCAFINGAGKVRVRGPECCAVDWKKIREDARAAVSEKEVQARAAVADVLGSLNHMQRRRVLLMVGEKFGYRLHPETH